MLLKFLSVILSWVIFYHLISDNEETNEKLVRALSLQHRYLKGNSTERQICFQRLEFIDRKFDVGVSLTLSKFEEIRLGILQEDQLSGVQSWLRNVYKALESVDKEIESLKFQLGI